MGIVVGVLMIALQDLQDCCMRPSRNVEGFLQDFMSESSSISAGLHCKCCRCLCCVCIKGLEGCVGFQHYSTGVCRFSSRFHMRCVCGMSMGRHVAFSVLRCHKKLYILMQSSKTS